MHYHRLRNTAQITIDGVRVYAAGDQVPKPVRNGLYKNTYEDAERRLLQHVLRRGDRVLEIGAGIGVVGLVAARIAGGRNVLSYEANPALEEIIYANYSLNDEHPQLRLKAITPDGSKVVFHQADNVLSSSIHERREARRSVTVESDSLSAVLEDFSPDVLVMDVEGAETQLLTSAPLDGIRAIVLELHPHIVGEEAIARLEAHLEASAFKKVAQDRKTVLLERDAADVSAS